MKRICNLSNPTTGLASYLAQGGDPDDWERFRQDARDAYWELRDKLVKLQHGICGYCEIRLHSEAGFADLQVEHITPQSNPEYGPAQALNYKNLIASCLGGSGYSLFGPEAQQDPARYLPDVSDNLSCGQAKGDWHSPDFVDPRNLPALPSLLRVLPTGIIMADDDACDAAGIAVCRLQKTIAILGLNVERLRIAREQLLLHLHELYDFYGDNLDAMELAAREHLLPDDAGDLPGFFTTARSYFGELAELILAEPPQPWI